MKVHRYSIDLDVVDGSESLWKKHAYFELVKRRARTLSRTSLQKTIWNSGVAFCCAMGSLSLAILLACGNFWPGWRDEAPHCTKLLVALPLLLQSFEGIHDETASRAHFVCKCIALC
eukprot:4731155-Amphidinium_carterae.1